MKYGWSRSSTISTSFLSGDFPLIDEARGRELIAEAVRKLVAVASRRSLISVVP